MARLCVSCQYPPTLSGSVGLSRPLTACALGSLIASLAGVEFERATHRWLQHDSALGELLDLPIESISHMQIYRASDSVVRHRQVLEKQVFQISLSLFDLQPTVTLYDLPNTYLEGEARTQLLAQHGHSKEQRSDCRLLTLALVLDASGFMHRSQVFAGSIQEATILQSMIKGLGAAPGALVVLDRGIATAATLEWLEAQGYHYLAVSRERQRHFEATRVKVLSTASGGQVQVELVRSEDGRQVRLYCYSREREKKEQSIEERRSQRLEAGLEKLHMGLSRPKAPRKLESVQQRVGRLKERSKGAARHYEITVETDASGAKSTAVHWERRSNAGTRATHAGVYCLRSNRTDWEAEAMWRAYVGLTDMEAMFRSLKSELGLRPVCHHKPERSAGHLLITVLAFHMVQVVRRHLREQWPHSNWSTLRQVFGRQRRVKTTLQCANGKTLHMRQSTEPELQDPYKALDITERLGPTSRFLP